MLQKTGVKNIENNVYLFMIKFVGDKGCSLVFLVSYSYYFLLLNFKWHLKHLTLRLRAAQCVENSL